LRYAALWWGISGLANAHAVEAPVEDPGSLPAGVAAAWFDGWAWLPCLALFLCALLVLMPDGRLASRRWWPAPASVAILLEIADDGHGMNERRIGVGMQTMRERATELGGTCQITSTPGARASVAARLPALASGVEAG
jgi:hypothetical protein